MPGLGSLIQLAVVGTLCVLLIWAAVSDARSYIIPNRVCAGLFILFPAYALSQAPIDIGIAVGIAAAVFAVGATLFHFGLMGGGDVKLLTGVSLWAGGSQFLPFLLMTSLAGGFLALSYLFVFQYLAPCLPAMKSANGRPAVPYGVAISVGGLFVAANLV